MDNLLNCRICGRHHQGFYLINKRGNKSMFYVCDFGRKPVKIYAPLIDNLPLKVVESKNKIRQDNQTTLF